MWRYLLRTLHIVGIFHIANADVPVHCRHDQIVGEWTLHVAEAAGASLEDIQCAKLPASKQNDFSTGPEFGFAGDPNFKVTKTLKVTLSTPDVAKSGGMTGKWTMIYDQGFQISIGGNTYFAFSQYDISKAAVGSDDEKVLTKTSKCHLTFPGWYSRDDKATGLATPCSLGCFYAVKSNPSAADLNIELMHLPMDPHKIYRPEDKLVDTINGNQQSTWKAQMYPELFEGKTMAELQRMGGKTDRPPTRTMHQMPTYLTELTSSDTDAENHLPKSFDWRNVNGTSFVNDPVNQGSCGSCYAVASADVLTSRLKIKGLSKGVVSSQQILCADRYTQGCNGGFPLLVWLFGQSWHYDTDIRYEGNSKKETCEAMGNKGGDKIGAVRGNYIGGYYGACSEEQMMQEVHANGPIVVAFEATPDFYHYSSGVYQGQPSGQNIKTKNRWEKTNHAVVVVGWGTDDKSGPYWIVKNSWGKEWGEQGYFKIRRGQDDNSIESMASAAQPVLLDKEQVSAHSKCGTSSDLVDEWLERGGPEDPE